MRHDGRAWLALLLIAAMGAACAGTGEPPASASVPVASSGLTATGVAALGSLAPSGAPTATTTAEPSCDPACLLMRMQPPSRSQPGKLPAGTYTTKHFYPGGLSVTLDGHWSSKEDSTGEFNLSSDRNPLNDELLFWLDMTPVTFDGKPVAGVASTPEAVSGWLHDLSWLTVSPATSTTIGADKMPAIVMDLSIPKGAPNGDPGCPSPPCVNVFTFPEFDYPWAMASDMKTRVYLAQVGAGPHMLFIMLNTIDAKVFAPVAQPVLDSVRLSKRLG